MTTKHQNLTLLAKETWKHYAMYDITGDECHLVKAEAARNKWQELYNGMMK